MDAEQHMDAARQILSMEQYLQMLTAGMKKSAESGDFCPLGRENMIGPAHAAMQDQEKRFQKIIAAVTDYIYTVVIHDDGTLTTSHGSGCGTVTGYTPEEYRENPHLWYTMVHEEDRQAVSDHILRFFSREAPGPIEHRIVRKDGSVRWVRNTLVPHHDETGRLVSYDGLILDITDRKRVEEQLYQAQKMEAVGALAGGVAHDFNNLITATFGYIDLIKMKMDANDPVRGMLDQIVEATTKVLGVTRGLLSFSRKQELRLRKIDLNEVVRKMEPLVHRLFSEDIELIIDLEQGELELTADKCQIEQILLNLVANAKDALPGSGMISVRTARMMFGEDYAVAHGYGKPGAYAVLSVEDTGEGMNEETRKRIFEPFFTTKGDSGTGLGLSIIYGIVKQHGGYINVYSETGKGTVFKVYLPMEKSDLCEAGIAEIGAIVGGTETILVAEDDSIVRSLIKDTLESYGYTVIASADGEEALKDFRSNSDSVSLLILDTVMPRKGGKEVCADIRKLRPDIKVIFMSAYSEDIIRKKKLVDEGTVFLSKPMLPHHLLKTIRAVLDNTTLEKHT